MRSEEKNPEQQIDIDACLFNPITVITELLGRPVKEIQYETTRGRINMNKGAYTGTETKACHTLADEISSVFG